MSGHLRMSIPLRTRLANRKADRAYKNYSEGVAYNGWDGEGRNRERVAYFNGAENSDWRFVGYADEVASLRHAGYYTDEYQEGTCRGAVWQLPARGGETRYVPGYVMSDSDAAAIRFTDVYEDKEDCAHAADSIAERLAEREREYQEREGKRIRAEELADDVRVSWEDIRALMAERRAVRACGHAKAYETITDRVQTLVRDIRAAQKELAKIEREYGVTVGDED